MQGPGRLRAAATAWALAWVAVTAFACAEDTADAGEDAAATHDGALGDGEVGDGAAGDGAAGDGAGEGVADAAGDGANAVAQDVSTADGQGGDVGDHVIEAKTPQALETDEAGKSGDLVFEIPANTAGFALTATAEAKVHLAFEGLTTPDGEAIVPVGWIEQDVSTGGQICLSCKIRVAPQQGSSAILVPNAPGVEATPGTWSVRVRAWTQSGGGGFSVPKKTPYKGTVSVTLALQPGPPRAFGRIDLNVFWSGAEGLTATTAAGDAEVQGWMQRYAELYAQVGLSVGAIRHFDLPAGHQVVEAMASDNSGFAEISALTASAPPGLNLVMVREITSPFGGMGAVLGVSGGIPGPVAVPGAARSMVVVAFPDIPAGFGRPATTHDVGLTIAHEGGHYLGLFHSSENDFGGFGPKLHDPLPDTPEKDATNLMYFDGGSGGAKLSPQQGAVLRANPWVQLLSSMGGQP